MSKFFFVNEATGKRYEVVHMDPAKKIVTLRGELTDRTFTETLDEAAFKRMGYTLMREN